MWDVPSRVTLNRRNKLGDGLSVLTGLEHFCSLFRPESKITVCNVPVCHELMDIFEFPHIDYDESDENAECLDEVLFTYCLVGEVREFWPAKFYTCLCVKAGIPVSSVRGIQMPVSKLGAWEDTGSQVACGQFDTRSGAPLEVYEIKRMLSVASFGKEVILIGGPDTKPYMGDTMEYRCGNVLMLAKELLKSSHFIGADSGVGHLAGYLGVPLYIVNTCGYHSVYIFYRKYPHLHLIERDFIRGIMNSQPQRGKTI